MDKKKVKELSLDVLDNIKEAMSMTDDVILCLKLANIASKISLIGVEVNKSDWISVEDELPPYDEVVLVCCSQFPSDVWICKRTKSTTIFKDYREFIIFDIRKEHPITHWRKIDKLEE